jgi:hypothetical protein
MGMYENLLGDDAGLLMVLVDKRKFTVMGLQIAVDYLRAFGVEGGGS